MCRGSVLSFLLLCPHMVMALESDISDPTKPLGYFSAEKPVKPLHLQAIFSGNGRKEAIVSGILVAEGDRVHGMRVVAIGKNRVTLQGASGSKELFLRASIFHQ